MTDKTIKDLFDGYAGEFDSIYGQNRNFLQRLIDRRFRRSMALRMKLTVEGCEPIAGKRVLDVGCGSGRYAVRLAQNGAAEVVGVDIAPQMLELARRYAEAQQVADRCRFLEADIMDFTEEKPFDYTLAMGVMDYIPSPVPFLKHLMQLTQGKLFLSFPSAGGLLEWQRRLRYRWFSRCELYFYDPDTLQKLIQSLEPHHFQIQPIARDFFVEIVP